MIIVRKIRLEDAQGLVKFMIKNNIVADIEDETEYYICKVDDSLYGFGMMVKKEDFCIIKNVVVDEEKRREKLGSSIIKTMLNSAELGGAKTAICLGDVPSFSQYLNFKKENIMDLPKNIKSETKKLTKNQYVYVVSLIDYFESACH